MIDGLLLMLGAVAVTALAAWIFLVAEDEADPPNYVYFIDTTGASAPEESSSPKYR